MLRILKNQKEVQISIEELLTRAKKFSRVYIDLGAGDSRFLYSVAKQNPDIFCISLDANADAMKPLSWKVGRKPHKGGLLQDNLVFLISAVEKLPKEMKEITDQITIHYPWGSLLRGVVVPIPKFIETIASLAKEGAEVRILLNITIFKDKDYLTRLKLPFFDSTYLKEKCLPVYERCFLQIQEQSFQEPTYATLWKNKLTLGEAKRETMQIQCQKLSNR